MKPEELLSRHYELLNHLSLLPKKMVSLHGHENMTEFVLHELCDEHCFNLQKAAYFIDNPDFDCLKGIVGFSRDESMKSCDIWQSPDDFSGHMKQSPFNQKVRGLLRASIKKNHSNEKDVAAILADYLGLQQPNFCVWNMKHDNTGILLFEKTKQEDPIHEDHLQNGLSLLSFCPVF
ncbi:MAG: hypothetical protein NTX86_01825 [Candidatus Dependentiae bacterium]|nr:hypothetical protein [Candidatus Dependentiae bacterium]